MFAALAAKIPSPWLKRLPQHRAWILVGFTVLFVLVVRVRLREMPLERDEGEYAYAGQLMLQGIPPYKEAYNMKLPGTYAAYAIIMALFGQSASAIHFGLALVSAGSVVLVFLIGRRLLDDLAGVVAAIVFALLSLSPSVLGLAAHATHFVILFALAGIFVLLKALESIRRSADIPVRSNVGKVGSELEQGASIQRSELAADGNVRAPVASNPQPSLVAPKHPSVGGTLNSQLFLASGLLFGFAFLMKQHGIFFGLFGGLYLLWVRFTDSRNLKPALRAARSLPRHSDTPTPRHLLLHSTLLFSSAFLLPYLLTCLVLWQAGVFHQFVFWTISYARTYATTVPIIYGPDVLRAVLDAVVGPNLGLWLLPWAGALLMWWEQRLSFNHRFLIIALLFCSFASVSLGFHFRKHYFITLLPVLALMCGVAVSRAVHVLRHDKTSELFLAVPILGLFLVGSLTATIGNGGVWFGMFSAEAIRATYGTTAFSDAVKIADYIKSNSGKNTRIAVVGSEPEIYFYSHRRSATGSLYPDPL